MSGHGGDSVDEQVTARCQCGWESEPALIDPEVINGEWFARKAAAAQYRLHFNSHRPLPTYVTSRFGSRLDLCASCGTMKNLPEGSDVCARCTANIGRPNSSCQGPNPVQGDAQQRQGDDPDSGRGPSALGVGAEAPGTPDIGRPSDG